MNLIKRTSEYLIICLLLAGCAFFDAGTKKLDKYCPRLSVDIFSYHEIIGSTKTIWILHYHKSFQQRVDTYFSNKVNGFTSESRSVLLNELGRIRSKVYSDSVLTKTIKKVNERTSIIYDKPVHRIVIIEQFPK